MNRPIVVTEHAEWEGVVDHVDVDALRSLSPMITVVAAGSHCQVSTSHFVGTLTLPSGRRFEVTPKVPIGSVLYMLAKSNQLNAAIQEELCAFRSWPGVVEFLAQSFCERVAVLVREGLWRTYREDVENSRFVRGRIHFADDLRLNAVTRTQTFCEVADLSWDMPHNQVIRQVLRLLEGWELDARVTAAVRELNVALSEVTPGRFRADELRRFTYSRFTLRYLDAHRLAYLILAGLSINEREGAHPFRSFFVDMNALFEAFITAELGARVPKDCALLPQAQMHLAHGRRAPIRPDLLLQRNGRSILVADCKYKRAGADEQATHDLFQVVSYCIATGVRRGALIYPDIGGPETPA